MKTLLRCTAAGLLVALTACSASGPQRSAPSQADSPSAAQHVVEIGATSRCPQRLGEAQGVRNSVAAAPGRLVPGARPDTALVCAYAVRPSRRLDHEPVRLDRPDAVALDRALAGVRLGVSSAPTSCPADFGTADLILFRYRDGPSFGLWYTTSGCQELDNGVVQTGEIANSSFWPFRSVIEHVVPSLRRPPH